MTGKNCTRKSSSKRSVVFSHIRRGDHIFVASGCGEPQYLVNAMVSYVETHPKAFFDTEIIHVYSFGIAPYTDPKFKRNFRLNSFFIGNNTRGPVNQGLADYTPVSLSNVPALIKKRFGTDRRGACPDSAFPTSTGI